VCGQRSELRQLREAWLQMGRRQRKQLAPVRTRLERQQLRLDQRNKLRTAAPA